MSQCHDDYEISPGELPIEVASGVRGGVVAQCHDDYQRSGDDQADRPGSNVVPVAESRS